MASRRRLAGALVSAATLIAGCNSILGIEELSSGPRPGGASGGASSNGGNNTGGSNSPTSGNTGTGGSGATAGVATAGGVSNAGSGGTPTGNGGGVAQGGNNNNGGVSAGNGGVVTSGGTSSVAGEAGAGGDMGGVGGEGGGVGGEGGGAGGTGGSGTGGSGFSGTVTGKVINLWGYPLSGVAVSVSGVSASATTKSDGTFTVAGVTAPYDVSFVVRALNNGPTVLATHAWLYRGLRRADPTFRVERGANEHSGNMTVTQSGAPAAPTPLFGVSVGTPYGRMARSMTAVGIANASVPLWGATAAQGSAHLLSFFASNGLPTSYSAHATATVPVDVSAMVTQTFDMTPPTVPLGTGTVTGTVVTTGSGTRTNSAWLQFTDHALIKLAEYTPTNPEFAYTVPVLANSTVTVAASQGNPNQGPYAIVHKNGLVSGGNATLTLPTPSELATPVSGTAINASTVFEWTNSESVSVVRIQSEYRWIYVVTAEHSTTIPSSLFQALGIAGGSNLEFNVETHGSVASVDAATGPRGFLDEFSHSTITPDSPVPGDGSFTFSLIKYGTLAP